MRLTEKMCQREAHIKGWIAEVDYLVVEQNQFSSVDQSILRAEIAVNQTVLVLKCFPRQRVKKSGGYRNCLGGINIVRLQAKTLEVGGIRKLAGDFGANLE